MREVAHILLHQPSWLTPGGAQADCDLRSLRATAPLFSKLSRGATAAVHLGDLAIVKQIKTDFARPRGRHFDVSLLCD